MKAPDLNQGLRCEDAEVRIGAKALLSRASVRLAHRATDRPLPTLTGGG